MHGRAIAWTLAIAGVAFGCAPSTTGAGHAAAPAEPAPIEVAVTVDDLPVHGPSFPGIDRVGIAEGILAAFRRHHLPPVYGFVNAKITDADPATESILQRWVETGNLLGNHTYSHVNLNDVDLPAYFADLERGEAVLKQLEPSGAAWKYFRYRFLREGDTVGKRDGVRQYLRDHGYASAEVTLDADDWAFNPPFARCFARGDTAAIPSLLRTLVDVHVQELRRVVALCDRLVHRPVKHVLLLHIGAAEAASIDDLLSAYEREGVRWIELPTALADPFYAIDPALPVTYGAAFPYLVARARGVTVSAPIFAGHLEQDLQGVCQDRHP